MVILLVRNRKECGIFFYLIHILIDNIHKYVLITSDGIDFFFTDFLPQNRFKELLQDCETKDINNWRRLYVARYIVIQEHRGIVLCKGYLLSAHRK